MTPQFNVALAQVQADADVRAAVAEARGADVVVFPEMFSNGYAGFDPADPDAEQAWIAGAVPPDGGFVDMFREAARSNRIHIVATFLEAANPRPFNTAQLIGPDGRTLLRHRKVHTCDFDSPEHAIGRGAALGTATIETAAGPVNVGLLICMDREYAGPAQALSREGADVILIPNACDLAGDPVVGDVRIAQLRGRAFETATAIAVANYPAPRYDGHSLVVGPQGEILAMADDRPAVLRTGIDLAQLRRVREEEWFRWRDR